MIESTRDVAGSRRNRASQLLQRLLGKVNRHGHDLPGVEIDAHEPASLRVQFDEHGRPPQSTHRRHTFDKIAAVDQPIDVDAGGRGARA